MAAAVHQGAQEMKARQRSHVPACTALRSFAMQAALRSIVAIPDCDSAPAIADEHGPPPGT
jgi:hypothetical protein